MDNDYVINEPTVPYYAHEGMLARNERTIKRLIIALVASIIATFATNAMWLYEWSQYDYESTESEVKVGGENGIANYIGNDGDITNGMDKGTKTNQKKNP